jgi:chromosome partitioning protein
MTAEKTTRVIAIANHKGGVGKTTTAVNLSAELGKLGLSVLLIDMDPQANASLHIGKAHPSEVPVTCAELLTDDVEKLPMAIHEETNLENVHLIYGSLKLGKVEDDLHRDSPRPSEELSVKIRPLHGIYDVIVIDCPPSLKLLTSNALSAATHIIIPIKSGSQYGMYGVTDLMNHVKKIQRINPNLTLLGALLLQHDERQTVCRLIEGSAQEQIGKIIPVRIPTSTKVDQAAIAQTSMNALDRTSKVAREYKRLASIVAEQLGLSEVA